VSRADRDADPLPIAVVLAGGGTGGHLMPGLAVRERLVERAAEAGRPLEVRFIASDRPLDARILDEAGVAWEASSAAPFAPRHALRFARGWHRAEQAARRRLRGLAASGAEVRLVGVGGFVAAPAARAAARLGLPVTMLNLDAVPGKANRLMRRWADHVLSASPCPDHPDFPDEIIGLPLRSRALAPDDAPAGCRRRLGLDPERPTLLVTGASQGAGTINDAVLRLAAGDPGRLAGWQELHLAGRRDAERMASGWADVPLPSRVIPFLDAMGDAWGAATLAISRAGASSVAEAVRNAVPTIFLPYPWHRDRHQERNVADLLAEGLAWRLDDSRDAVANAAALAPRLEGLMADPDAIERVRDRLRRHPTTDAADLIARRLLGLEGPIEP